MNAAEEAATAREADFGEGSRVFAYSFEYSNFKTMEIVTGELSRNILLALVCVFAATLVLIADIIASLLVVFSVFVTLVCVAGFVHFWGLTIEVFAAVLFTISMGLAVDYSAHVTHGFMVAKGTRNERVHEMLTEMGPAVLNGGFSTFLAFVLLSTSSSYGFQTFFKIFFLIVLFGLFFGLVFLPVVLSLVGPRSPDYKVEPAGAEARPPSAWDPQKKNLGGNVY